MRFALLIVGAGFLHVALAGCAAGSAGAAARERRNPPGETSRCRVDVLNALRNDLNTTYGFRDGAPRINLGPCGRFARDLRERWNDRFDGKMNIAFVMDGDGPQCHHVLVKLADGDYFDGGNGVITAGALRTLYPGSRIEEMTKFDPALLDARSYGLSRSYPECPNYSDALTDRLIDRHLALLPADVRGP